MVNERLSFNYNNKIAVRFVDLLPDEPTNTMPIGKQLYYYRCQLGYSREQVSKAIGVCSTSIGRIEIDDTREFNLDWIKRYIAYLNCGKKIKPTGYVGFMMRNPAQLIRERRRELGMTNQQFCEYVGVSDNTISRWEHGYATPSYHFWKQLKAIFPDF